MTEVRKRGSRAPIATGAQSDADRAPSRPVRRTQAERRQATQEKLVQSAIALLKSKRYAGFRTLEVAAAAGVSRGAQTHHFATKDDLVLMALEQVYRETSARSRERLLQAGATREALVQALVHDSADFFLGDDFLLSLDLVMVGADAALGDAVRRLARRYRFAVEEEWHAALVASGVPQAQAQDIIWLTFAIGRGLGVRQVISGPSARLRQVLQAWADVALQWRAPAARQRPLPRSKAEKAAKPVEPGGVAPANVAAQTTSRARGKKGTGR